MQKVGDTPLVRIDGVYAKLECTNPTGSVKDRIARYILETSRARGLLAPGQPIVEATSGNTGIAMSWFARELGHPITIVMPEDMTEERKQMIRKLGAELVLCSKEGSFAEAASIRDALARERGWFNPDQFSNPLNAECHAETTAVEILEQVARATSEPIDAFVAGVGTGGTLVGVGRKLRSVHPRVHIAAVEPAESAVLSGGPAGAHGIPGIGDGFIPALVSDGAGGVTDLVDEVIPIGSDAALGCARRLGDADGFCVGISSGANLLAARKLARRFRTVVTIFPDGYAKYRSRGLMHCAPGSCRFEHVPLVEP